MPIQKNEAVRLALAGAFFIKPSVFEDNRGAFHKIFTSGLLESIGVKPEFSEEFISTSKKGVLRGLHYQRKEFSQARLVWCPKGKLFDVMVDLRKSSPTFGKWVSFPISGEDVCAIYIPRGFAHGFLALEDDTRMVYKTDSAHSPPNERGIIYNDAKLGIKWPLSGKMVLSEKDAKWPSFEDCEKFD